MIRYIIILIITMIFSCMKLSDPFIPVDQTGGYTVKKTLRTTGWALDIAIFDTNAYIAQGEAGIAVLSINDIDNPVLLSEVGTDIGGNDKLRGYISKVSVKCTLKSFIDLPGHAKDVCTNKSLAFVACKMDGLCIVDFTNPSSLKLVSSYKAQSSIENVCCKDTIVYLIDGKNFVALSVANPANPYIIGKIKMTYPAGIKTYKDYILVADRRDGLVIIQHSGDRM